MGGGQVSHTVRRLWRRVIRRGYGALVPTTQRPAQSPAQVQVAAQVPWSDQLRGREGQWVAVKGLEVVAAGPTCRELVTTLHGMGTQGKGAILQHVGR